MTSIRSVWLLLSLQALTGCALLDDAGPNVRVELSRAAAADSLRVSIHNHGREQVEHHYGVCTPFLEKREGGVWQGLPPVTKMCSLVLIVGEIPPGETRSFAVSVTGLAGEYRANLGIVDDDGPLPAWMRVSNAVHLP